MWNVKNEDVEAGSPLLYPSMQQSPQLRWAFIRKVYSILTLQLLVTIGFAALVVAVQPIARFFHTAGGITVYVFIVIFPLIVVCFLYAFQDKHPVNFILLAMFTVCFGLAIGVACAFTSGRAILEAAIATAVVVISLTLYTFWAAKRGYDFSFLAPFLLSVLVILLTLTIFQIFYPLGKFTDMLLNGLYIIIFSAYIIYDTDTLIKRNTYDQYIWASISLYLDVLNVFLRLLQIISRAANK